MGFKDIILTAISNSFRSKLRTALTVVAIFIGAFTLTLTNGIGTGVSNYIDDQVSSVGAKDLLIITAKNDEQGPGGSDEPKKYDPNEASLASNQGPPGTTQKALEQEDIDKISTIPGVSGVEPVRVINTNYIQWEGKDPYMVSVSATSGYAEVGLAAGAQLDMEGADKELLLPTTYITSMGFASAEDAVGKTVKLGVKDSFNTEHVVEAVVKGVQDKSLFSSQVAINNTLAQELFARQSTNLPPEATAKFAAAVAKFDRADDEQAVTDVKAAFGKDGYQAQTVADQIGTFKTVVDAIVQVLNFFAIIALIAASFGIINTLLMSVQERTREIGLMKAMGMGSGRVFSLFSAEAVFIGFLGSVIGSVVAIGVGTAVSSVLAGGFLKDLPGLRLLEFSPFAVGGTILAIMFVAFLAGTLPAYRAAKQNPIDSLRYE